MKEFHGHASARVNGEPQAAFDLITDGGLLPEWNAAIEAVRGNPARLSTHGACA
jgi:hypothetical protein